MEEKIIKLFRMAWEINSRYTGYWNNLPFYNMNGAPELKYTVSVEARYDSVDVFIMGDGIERYYMYTNERYVNPNAAGRFGCQYDPGLVKAEARLKEIYMEVARWASQTTKISEA